jgi:hypothetical protein
MKMKYDTTTIEGKIAVMEHFRKNPEGLMRSLQGYQWQVIPIGHNPSWNWVTYYYNYPAEPEPPKETFDGYYSATQERMAGSSVYMNLNGEVRIVTEVVPKGCKPMSVWKDLTFVGGVSKYVSDVRCEPPKLVPWTFETAPRSRCWLKLKGGRLFNLHLITYIDLDGIGAARWDNPKTYTELFKEMEHSTDDGRTWLPCGTEEKR